MSITPELLAQRLEILEKQITAFMANNTNQPNNPNKNYNKDKKEKKSTKSDSHDEPPKKKRVSGYILFGKAHRDNVKAELEAHADPHTKVKSTDVMKRLGELWKDLPDATRNDWNTKAKEELQP
tara:strand:- start:243 stop:614 length:372 start_codon:yes stop_codon:yes gene_type:complete